MIKTAAFRVNHMGKPGQKSYPISIRLPEGIIEAIDREVETYREETTRAEFIQDATKFYLRYKAEARRKASENALVLEKGSRESPTSSGRT